MCLWIVWSSPTLSLVLLKLVGDSFVIKRGQSEGYCSPVRCWIVFSICLQRGFFHTPNYVYTVQPGHTRNYVYTVQPGKGKLTSHTIVRQPYHAFTIPADEDTAGDVLMLFCVLQLIICLIDLILFLEFIGV